ncbi:hypothetical protein [Bacillus sp. B-jedd]|uniref:hypothetical protein n=1 Tax=Bacillus sp. B-jedd TaxID=1476857 RepID=UPI0005156AE1|nr:hypothetical protein [Bacillus sp. B-jedd]CEG25971.1 hypothetical protein BN1002_00809 [Bacillus sp. B-jedd]
MKQGIYLQPVQREMIKTAMRAYRKGLNGLGQRLFDIAYNKVKDMGRRIELDGMEMIFISQSLNQHGKGLSASGKIVESRHYRHLAMGIEDIRIHFQQTNGPKVKKEKAASASTLTA